MRKKLGVFAVALFACVLLFPVLTQTRIYAAFDAASNLVVDVDFTTNSAADRKGRLTLATTPKFTTVGSYRGVNTNNTSSGAFVTWTGGSSVSLGTKYAIEFYGSFNNANSSANQGFIAYSTLSMEMNSDGTVGLWYRPVGGSTYVTANTAVNCTAGNVYSHFVAVRNGNKIILYVNGVNAGSYTGVGSNSDVLSNGGDISIMYSRCAVYFKVYNAVPSATQVGYLYAARQGSCTHPAYTTVTAATCAATGTGTCKYCGASVTIPKNASNHSAPAASSSITTAATCTAAGVRTYYCGGCGAATSTEAVTATGHSFGSWTTTAAATCTAAGSKTRTCTRCNGSLSGGTEVQAIAATGHTYVATVVKPTITKQGYTNHVCSVCGASYKDNYVAVLAYPDPVFNVDFSKTDVKDTVGGITGSISDTGSIQYHYDSSLNRAVLNLDETAITYTLSSAVTSSLSSGVFALEAYVKAVDNSNWQFIAGTFTASGNQGFGIGYGTNGVWGTASGAVGSISGIGSGARQTLSRSASGWTHIIYTFDGANESMYINGILAGSSAVGSTTIPSGNSFRIGAYNTLGQFASYMDIAYVRLYARAVDSEDAAYLYTHSNLAQTSTSATVNAESSALNVKDFGDGYYPVVTGKLFGGWYTSTNFTESNIFTGASGTAYAKFVNSNVLSVKCQLSQGTTASSASTNLRILTTTDSLNYDSVGFEITINGKTRVIESQSVYKALKANAANGFAALYTPNMVCEDSTHFMAFTLKNIPNSAFGTSITIRPYWTVFGGGRVYGLTRTVTVNSGLSGS